MTPMKWPLVLFFMIFLNFQFTVTAESASADTDQVWK